MGLLKSQVWGSVLAVLLPLGAATPVRAQQTTPATKSPDLTHDSDPVPSADPDKKIVTATPQQTQAPSSSVGQITEENGEFTLRTGAYEVRLNASVVDSRGVPVDSLPKSAFQVYEDGVQQNILGFRHEDLPVSLGIVIDSSGSMYDKRAAVDAASIDLVRLSNPQDEAFLVDFSSEPYLDQDFTSNVAQLQKGLAYVKSSGGTALYDAVVASADHLAKSAKNSKQVLLIVTDGDDNASTNATLEAAIRRVQNLDGPVIYCIGLLFGDDVSHSEAKHSRQVLTELANQTGGAAYFPKSLKEVDDIAKDVAADIRTQYTISYRSTNPPQNGGYRQVHVEAKEKGFRNLTVRTRAGYFPKIAKAPAAPSK
ncbi:VWA domain-containing protein [Granulicella cerasi]|uniref:VWA domain-containing protein n=1 Tax=Granulicella cerasi TaxID=741063 RepID=A0ABW1Z6Z6_9BACT|nr:VWA domain-containing protein [Granulicella cerasi]